MGEMKILRGWTSNYKGSKNEVTPILYGKRRYIWSHTCTHTHI